MKTKEELNILKNEVENLKRKLTELTEDELKLVLGGAADLNADVPNVKAPAAANIGISSKVDYGVGLTASALEMSNVDIAQEFENMIKTQRALEANSRVITISDEIYQAGGLPKI